MGRIDTTKIEGYADMTPEERIAALEAYEYDDHADEIRKLKDSVNKASGEASQRKKDIDGYQQKMEEMEATVKSLTRSANISDYTAKLISTGFSADAAKSVAEALADGKIDDVFGGLEAFRDAYGKQIKDSILKDTPDPAKGSGNTVVTKDKFLKMSYDEQRKYKEEHPNWRNELK